MEPNLPPHRIEQFSRIEPNAVAENDLYLLDIRNLVHRISIQDHQVGLLALGNGADLIFQAEELGTVECRDPDRLGGSKPAINQKLDVALIPEAPERAAVPGGI